MNASNNGLITLENERMLAQFNPQDGARLVRLVEKSTGTALIWTNKRTKLVTRYYGCNYDDLSNGGVEEAFPTVQPCAFADAEKLPFFGEIWAIPWDAQMHGDTLTMSCLCPIFPAEVKKTFSFSQDGWSLMTDYEIRNIGMQAFQYVFGVHPSLTLFEDSCLYAPPERYSLCVSMPQTITGPQEMTWPWWGNLDFRYAMPADSLGCYQLVAMPVQGNHYGVYHPSTGVGIDVAFDPGFFRCLSLWPIYGGFRGHMCLMSEVFTCYPAALDEAVRLGLAEKLLPGTSIKTSVVYTLLMSNPAKEESR